MSADVWSLSLPAQQPGAPRGVGTVPRLVQDGVEALPVHVVEQVREDLDGEARVKSAPPQQRHHRAQHRDNP